MEDKDVQDALKNVHGEMPPEYHELLCRGAWKFQANTMTPLSTPWVEFCRFAFAQKLGNEERRVYADLAGSNGGKPLKGITDWQRMFVSFSIYP